MSDWWWVLIVAVVLVVVAGVLYQRSRRTGVSDSDSIPGDASRNYGEEREANRLGGMSEEDRAWETASRERNRKTEARDASPPERD